MDVDSLLAIVAWLFLVVAVAASSASLSALTHLNKNKLRYMATEGVERAKSLVAAVESVPFLEATMAILSGLSIALGAAVPALAFSRYATADPVLFYGMGVIGLLMLMWIHSASRTVGALHPEETLHYLRWLLLAAHFLLRPVVMSLRALTLLVLPSEKRLMGVLGSASNEEELRMIVDAVQEERGLEEEERDMIHGIFELGETTAREIMVPRVDMVAVDAEDPLHLVLDRIMERGKTRIPVFEGNIDNIVGIVHAKDLLQHVVRGPADVLDEPCRSLARPAYFVPSTKKIDELLHEMQGTRTQMAITVDEYGGTAGLVTIEDLLEEIVGEIQDEYDVEERSIEKVTDQEAIFDARVPIDDVNETLGTALTNGEYDSVGGLAYDRLGKIPVVGDQVEVDGATLTIVSTVGKRVKKVRIRVQPHEDTADVR